MLIKTLPRIAAKILKNTHVGPGRYKEKFLLITEAYGAAAVERDFETWCNEQLQAEKNPRYPLTEYIKVIDERLGGGFSEVSQSQFDITDPHVVSITSTTYEHTGYLPAARSVAGLLKTFTEDQILKALEEYVNTLDDKEWKSGLRQFFTEGGCAAIISAQQRRQSE